MSDLKSLFVIDTPTQVFNLQEALIEYRITSYDIIICDCCRADAFVQLQKLLSRLTPENLIEVPRVTGSIEDRIHIYAQHLPWLKQQQYAQVFFSNIRQQWQRDIVCSLTDSRAILMDDGNATLVFYRYLFLKQKFFDFPQDPDLQRREIAADVRSKLGVCVNEPSRLELFTIFNLPEKPWLSICKNKMTALVHLHQEVNHSQVLISGIGAVELQYLTDDQYISLLNLAQELFPGKQIIYQPHRISSSSLIDKISRQTRLEVVRLNQPVEDWLLHHPCPPATVVSFFSMVLSTISLCFPALQVVSLDPGEDAWSGAGSSHVWNMTECNNLDIINTIMTYLKTDPSVKVISI